METKQEFVTMRKRSIQIICADRELGRTYLGELEQSGESYRVQFAPSMAEARRNFGFCEPAVILLDESAVPGDAFDHSLDTAVATLIETAPVVVVASLERQAQLGFLITSGAVDFIARGGDFVSIAVGLAERRIRLAAYAANSSAFAAEEPGSDFGEVLRHEVNNPLTGILGNAEMLLARRDRLPPGALERVETIAELAVRLRETVRRLSNSWGNAPHSRDAA